MRFGEIQQVALRPRDWRDTAQDVLLIAGLFGLLLQIYQGVYGAKSRRK